ncbi:hypothetical protein DL93DRAFT_2075565 [Clavulina sp. PMI_390]|nr:hypothetical protein DL93DRAFT_2075565 [Clavulina sp. PMI_390]
MENPPPSNYPPPGDSTSSGGYGTNENGNAFSDRNQRGADDLGRQRGIFADPSADTALKQTGGFQPASEVSDGLGGQTVGTAERRYPNVVEEGGAARAAGTDNNIGA